MLRTQRANFRIRASYQRITQAIPLFRTAPDFEIDCQTDCEIDARPRDGQRPLEGAWELHGKRMQLPRTTFAALDHAIERCALSNTLRVAYDL